MTHRPPSSHCNRVSRTYRLPGLRLAEHELSVPLDHNQPRGERIKLFARELADPTHERRPALLFFNGGPGFESPRPLGPPQTEGWIARALRDFRVILLDQRGTGRSTPVGALAALAPERQADYLQHFRADAIVRDAEYLRRELAIDRWSVLGQSYGGFCVTTYLSHAPDSLREALIAGGLPPLGRRIDESYAASYARVIERSRRYFERYPEDRERVQALHRQGDGIWRNRIRQLGRLLGLEGGAERLHYLIELPPDSPAFSHDLASLLPFARNPIYAALHEAAWADGGATRWAAQRLLPPDYEDEPELFTGEHLFPWMFEEYRELAPLRDAAYILAERDWPRLYDERHLAANEVPVAALIYHDDMYVDWRHSKETAARISGLRGWITNEYDHNGLSVNGGGIFERLLELVRR